MFARSLAVEQGSDALAAEVHGGSAGTLPAREFVPRHKIAAGREVLVERRRRRAPAALELGLRLVLPLLGYDRHVGIKLPKVVRVERQRRDRDAELGAEARGLQEPRERRLAELGERERGRGEEGGAGGHAMVDGEAEKAREVEEIRRVPPRDVQDVGRCRWCRHMLSAPGRIDEGGQVGEGHRVDVPVDVDEGRLPWAVAGGRDDVLVSRCHFAAQPVGVRESVESVGENGLRRHA